MPISNPRRFSSADPDDLKWREDLARKTAHQVIRNFQWKRHLSEALAGAALLLLALLVFRVVDPAAVIAVPTLVAGAVATARSMAEQPVDYREVPEKPPPDELPRDIDVANTQVRPRSGAGADR